MLYRDSNAAESAGVLIEKPQQKNIYSLKALYKTHYDALCEVQQNVFKTNTFQSFLSFTC
jgi:hypothetical protein